MVSVIFSEPESIASGLAEALNWLWPFSPLLCDALS
jgi:hypothetical protein